MPEVTDRAPSPWLTPQQAADRAQVGINALYHAVRAGKLKAVRIGARQNIRIHVDWLDAWLRAAVIVNPDAPGDELAAGPVPFGRRR